MQSSTILKPPRAALSPPPTPSQCPLPSPPEQDATGHKLTCMMSLPPTQTTPPFRRGRRQCRVRTSRPSHASNESVALAAVALVITRSRRASSFHKSHAWRSGIHGGARGWCRPVGERMGCGDGVSGPMQDTPRSCKSRLGTASLVQPPARASRFFLGGPEFQGSTGRNSIAVSGKALWLLHQCFD